MNLAVRLNRWPNFYYFIQNLSEWHFSVVPEHNKSWQEEGGALTKEEKQALGAFAAVHRKYSFDVEKPLFEPFLTYSQPLDALNIWLTLQEYSAVFRCFTILEKRFDKIYDKEYSALKDWENILIKKTKPSFFHTGEIVEILSKLYRQKQEDIKDVVVYPVVSGKTKFLNGSAYTGQRAVILPVSSVPKKKQADILSILWHEIIHVNFDHAWYLPFLMRKLPDIETACNVNEATAATLFPGGILANRFFHVPKENLYHGIIKKEQEKQILDLMAGYIEGNKKLDSEFALSMYNILK